MKIKVGDVLHQEPQENPDCKIEVIIENIVAVSFKRGNIGLGVGERTFIDWLPTESINNMLNRNWSIKK